MGIFNYIDTFFFISLGITFVFILLIVYHFKQQIKSLEQKNDTMFEIINNIVKEITNIRNVMVSPPQVQQNQIREVISLEREVPRIMVSDESEEEEEETAQERRARLRREAAARIRRHHREELENVPVRKRRVIY